MADRLSIIFWLWGREGPSHRYSGLYDYTPEMVNRMAAQVRRTMTHDFEPVVVTDYPADLFDSSIRHVDLMQHFGELRGMGGCWLRLKAFSAGMHDILGPRCAYIDLDSVVVADVAPLFIRSEPLVLLELGSVPENRYNGSVALWSPRETDWIWSRFDPQKSPQEARSLSFKGTDQSFLNMVCDHAKTPTFGWKDGILHYTMHCSRKLPEHARIVTWPGRLKPDNPSVLRRAAWLAEHLDAENPPSPTHLVPWPADAQKPLRFVMQTHRPTMQDIRRERRAMQRLQTR